ncbi:MAG: hypothetical protein ACI88A_004469 [Paraglaciecola sp.]|jgi:hypothetical protein
MGFSFGFHPFSICALFDDDTLHITLQSYLFLGEL